MNYTLPRYRATLIREGSIDTTLYPSVTNASNTFEMFRHYFNSCPQEEFWIIVVDVKNRIIGTSMITRGTINAAIVSPRDVFRTALQMNPASLIFMHNHPSGDPAPSAEDHALTRRLCEAGSILGIKVLDHIIAGRRHCYSFADEGLLS